MLFTSSCKFSTLVDLLRYRATEQPNQLIYTFLVDGETEELRITHQELDQKARTIAALLQYVKAPGERALLLYPPGLEFITAFFGCLYAGVIAVPAYPPRRNQRMMRLQAIAKDAQAKFALTTQSVLNNIEQSFSEKTELAVLHCIATDNIASYLAEDCRVLKLCENTLAFLQYTSGSTGIPKGVMVSHGNILYNSALIHKGFEDTSQSLGVSWLPPYHDMGLIGGVIQPLYVNAPMVLMSPVVFLYKPLRWLKAISQYKATTSGGPNFAYELCLNKITFKQKESLDLSSWQVAFNGAEPIRSETLERFVSNFESCGFRKEAFYPCYGMAEATLFISGGLKTEPPVIYQFEGAALEQNRAVLSIGKQQGTRRIVSCGQPCLDEKIVIVDLKSLTQCPSGQVGEIWVSGLHVAQGYWNRPAETEQVFKAFLEDTVEGHFLRTGDLGFLQDGQLFITGRLKDIIIIRGRNHYPQDIELTVEQSHPVLKPGCGAAFVVEINSEEQLIVVQEVERNYLRQLNINEVIGDICQAVACHHELRVYAVILVKTGSIPKTSSGKIQRYACRNDFLAGTLHML